MLNYGEGQHLSQDHHYCCCRAIFNDHFLLLLLQFWCHPSTHSSGTGYCGQEVMQGGATHWSLGTYTAAKTPSQCLSIVFTRILPSMS